jgi:hypothetical protein
MKESRADLKVVLNTGKMKDMFLNSRKVSDELHVHSDGSPNSPLFCYR